MEGLAADARPGQRDPSRDALSGEIAFVAFDRLKSLILRPALEALAGQDYGYVGAPRLQFGSLAQRELIAGRQQLVRA